LHPDRPCLAAGKFSAEKEAIYSRLTLIIALLSGSSRDQVAAYPDDNTGFSPVQTARTG
jgi:hypothetical protein